MAGLGLKSVDSFLKSNFRVKQTWNEGVTEAKELLSDATWVNDNIVN